MYTRSYSDEAGIVIPERYGGTSLGANMRDEMPTGSFDGENAPTNADYSDTDVHTERVKSSDEAVTTSAFISKLPFGGLLSNILKKDIFSLQNFGKEEFLIIAAAAFLLFSKEGDKECAIMLLLLLFFK